MVKKSTKKLKQFAVFYTLGSSPDAMIAEGTDYQFSTLEVVSQKTKELTTYPVVMVIDEEADSMDMIPMSQVSNIRYNWGLKAENEKYKNKIKEITGVVEPIKVSDNDRKMYG